jgi:hypothetical protein
MLRTYAEKRRPFEDTGLDFIGDSVMIKISPRYCQEQLDGGEITMVDVYADIVTGCIFHFADSIATTEHSGIAVLTLTTAVFEPLGGVLRGTGPRDGRENFIAGLDWICRQAGGSSNRKLGERIYHFVRCGLFHEGFIKPSICLKASDEAIAKQDDCIIIDTLRLLHDTEKQFEAFVARLKTDDVLRRNFGEYWRLRDEEHKRQLQRYWQAAAVKPPTFTDATTHAPSLGGNILATGDG